MTSLEELNNIVQTLQQTIQQQQEKINFLENQLNQYRADILATENNIDAKIEKAQENLEEKIQNAQQETTSKVDLIKTEINDFISDSQRKIIIFAAHEYSDGKNVTFHYDRSANGGEVITDARGLAGAEDRIVEFSFISKAGCVYRLDVEYAAADSRPLQILFNGNLLTENGVSQITGGWSMEHQKVFTEGFVTSKNGVNTLGFNRSGAFPHIRSVRLILFPSV